MPDAIVTGIREAPASLGPPDMLFAARGDFGPMLLTPRWQQGDAMNDASKPRTRNPP